MGTTSCRRWGDVIVAQHLSESGRSFSVKELADQVGFSKSTIERDLATLEGHSVREEGHHVQATPFVDTPPSSSRQLAARSAMRNL